MFTTPKEAATLVFDESLLALMAHTTTGLKKLFAKSQLDLDIRLIPDSTDHIGLLKGNDAPPSILHTRHHDASALPNRGRVAANIFIHQHANKHLARLCIAHETFHLLLELKAFTESAPKPNERVWPNEERIINPNNKTLNAEQRLVAVKKLEGDCDVFAWELCRQHDQFNRNDTHRSQFIYFPDTTFDSSLKTRSLRNRDLWPKGIELSPENPWWKKA